MKLTLIVPFSAGLLLAIAPAIAADNAIEQAKSAIQQLQQQDAVEFAYQRHSDFGDRTMLERYRPLPDSHGWTLVSENGEKPSTQRLSEYQQMKSDEWYSGQQSQDTEDQDQQSIKLSLSDMIQVDTLEFVGEQQWQQQTVLAYTFTPELDKFSDHDDKLQGNLYLNSSNQAPAGLSITLKQSFSPAMSVTLENFAMQIELMAIEGDEKTYYVPKQTEEKMAGSYLYFKDFSNQTVRKYSAYSVLAADAVRRVRAN